MSWALLANEDTDWVTAHGNSYNWEMEVLKVIFALKELGRLFFLLIFVILIAFFYYCCRSQRPHQTSHMQKASMTRAQIMGSSPPSRSYSHIHVTETFPVIFGLLLTRFIVFLKASGTFPVEDKQKRQREGEVQGSLSPTNSGVGC